MLAYRRGRNAAIDAARRHINACVELSPLAKTVALAVWAQCRATPRGGAVVKIHRLAELVGAPPPATSTALFDVIGAGLFNRSWDRAARVHRYSLAYPF